MNNHSLQKLEFDKIIQKIRGMALTPYGANEIRTISPLSEIDKIELRQTEISQMKDIINFGLPFPLYRMDDVVEILNQSKINDIFLEAPDILKLTDLLKMSVELKKYDPDGRDKFPLISNSLDQIHAFPELNKEIARTIDDDGVIKDNASKSLRSIRSELAETKRKITSRLQQILNRQTKTPGWQEDIVTIRNDRYVIGVPTSKYKNDMGILHDRSQTGATFFIEPKETVELNNRINMLYQEERQEMIKILRNLTKEIGTRADSLLNNIDLIGRLDTIHACAGFSNKIKGIQPILTDQPSFNFLNVRHPLLILQMDSFEDVIPNSLNLDSNRQAILITGPNTGGKTILLKTVGLSIMLAQSGLHIAADEKSEVGIFTDIFADIGDEQSIELSLSTFSSHITNIIDGLEQSNKGVLLLYDEIGAGTDPKEGSALAEAIILYGLEKGSKMIVTTHYSQLKTMAMEYAQLDNGSLEFDKESLAPTYKLRLGIPGSSYAVEIAQRLGMPKEICTHASSFLSSGEKSLDKLITSLEEELKTIKEDKIILTEKLEKANELETYYRTKSDYIKKQSDTEKEKMLAETKSFLENTRRDIEHLVAEIRKSEGSKESVKKFHHKLKEAESKLKHELAKKQTQEIEHASFETGDSVEILTLSQNGEIEEMLGNDKAKVKIGNLFTTVEIRHLKKLDSTPKKYSTHVSYNESESLTNISREIHLRGMTVDEALEKLEKFLDQAVMAGLNQVYVIHGKGAGILRRTLTEYLKNHKEVATLRLGDFNEGGLGVTVVKLKE